MTAPPSPKNSAAARAPKGSLQNGRYHLLHLLGSGGHAEVYSAIDIRLNVSRAVKILHALDEKRSRTLQVRLRAEAQALARIRHPNVIGVHDIGNEGPFDYIVMDLAEGGPISLWLEVNGPAQPELAVEWMLDVLSALAEAHALGIVHRDVKPGNILLDADGRPLLADFGIALLGESDARPTIGGVAMGSTQFMPPEQRVDAASVDHRADLFAAGATLYLILTGRSPADLYLDPDPASARWEDVPPAIAEVIRMACAMRPQERYGSAGAMADALLAAMPSFERRPATYPMPKVMPKAPARPRPAPGHGSDASTVLPVVSQVGWRPAAVAVAVTVVALAVLAGLAVGTVYRANTIQPASSTMAPGTPISDLPAAAPTVGALRPADPPALGTASGSGAAGQSPSSRPHLPPSTPVAQGPGRNLPAPAKVGAAPDPLLPTPTPFGRWHVYPSGDAGMRITLRLDGEPPALHGTVTSEMGNRAEAQPIQGKFLAEGRALELTDAAGAVYRLRLDPTLRVGDGTIAWRGKVRTVTMSWEPER